ncbi:hypothetical protein [Escherichia coli]|uniref:hypothetical protein n=1 Tax=Escherichia coli TaxID=562 RepID=UPI00096ABCA0|nr:hypothetical protein [Escherichia coli]EED1319212.1 hypothetical protein [Escherichia coli]EFJ4044977.1 hypothetical protein [Escherichia coli]EHC2248436.1 hypothetical protein [Escherichia coli]MBS9706742.1 hypothetical protein [Escherichia coli]HAW1021613.1 hypothetical protein [Escherichia coli]
MGEMVDINDELVRTVITVDDGCDHTQRFIWMMNTRRNIRNKVFRPEPELIKVARVRIEAKKRRKYRPRKARATVLTDELA